MTKALYSISDIVNLKNKEGVIEHWYVHRNEFRPKIGWLYDLRAYDHEYGEYYNVLEADILGHYLQHKWKDIRQLLDTLSPEDLKESRAHFIVSLENLCHEGKIHDYTYCKDTGKFKVLYPPGITEVLIPIYEAPGKMKLVFAGKLIANAAGTLKWT